MNIRIVNVDVEILKIFITIFGESIGRITPCIESDKLLFEFSILGHCSLSTSGYNVTIRKEDKEVTLDQRDFYKIIIL